MDKSLIAELVLGTYEHDLFKPFWLPNRLHADLGYEYLRQVEGKGEAHCAAVLFHTGAFDKQLKRHLAAFPETPHRLPKALIVAPWLDRLASASYAMLVDEKSGAERYGELEAWPASVQNPFSRLPVWTAAVPAGRLVAGDANIGTEFAEKLFQQPFTDLFPDPVLKQRLAELRAQLEARRVTLKPGDGRIVEVENAIADLVFTCLGQTSAPQRRLLREAYAVFAERTYPHPNDTSLAWHTRLVANLFHILLTQLTPTDELSDLGLETMSPEDQKRWRAETGLTSLHPRLRSWMVTIRFAGLQDRFESAVRLDDLNGAKALADRLRYALKRRILADLDLADVAGADELADLLYLSESPFTLTYLLPASYAGDSSELQERLTACYDASCYDVVSQSYRPESDGNASFSLFDVLASDLRDAPRDLQPDRAVLAQSLLVMQPAFGIARVDPTAVKKTPFEEHFGIHLLDAYQQAQQQSTPGSMPRSAFDAFTAAPEPADATVVPCSHCQSFPAWTELTDMAYGRNGRAAVPLLLKFFHGTETQPEELCQGCVAQRALAHGVTETPALAQMIRGTVQPDGGVVDLTFDDLRTPAGKVRLALPPLLQRRANLTADDGLADLSAAFVRVRRGAPDPLDRFPAVGYAADRNSNVAMITLRPTAAVFESQSFSPPFIDQMVRQEDRWLAATQAWQDLRRYYFNLDGAGKNGELQKLLSAIPPHLARTLQRQQTLTAFFDAFSKRLEAAGLRVLSLENRYPVGRFLVPAEALTTALEILDASICLDLLSVNAADLGLDDTRVMAELASLNLASEFAAGTAADRKQRATRSAALRAFLCSYLPQILVGTTLLFKQKQALYLMLRTEARLSRILLSPRPEHRAAAACPGDGPLRHARHPRGSRRTPCHLHLPGLGQDPGRGNDPGSSQLDRPGPQLGPCGHGARRRPIRRRTHRPLRPRRGRLDQSRHRGRCQAGPFLVGVGRRAVRGRPRRRVFLGARLARKGVT